MCVIYICYIYVIYICYILIHMMYIYIYIYMLSDNVYMIARICIYMIVFMCVTEGSLEAY